MIDLDFEVLDALPDRQAAAPTITLRLRVTEATGADVYALALRCQLRIEPQRRRYDDTEAEALRDLFGDRARWGDTLKPVQLGFLDRVVPSFTGATDADLPLLVSYDFTVAAHKYLAGVREGDIPLLLMFSGTAFTAGGSGVVHQPVAWHAEARYRMPVSVWQETMDLHFPGTAWIRLDRGTFDELHRYKSDAGLMSWDDAVRRLLKEADR